MLDERISIHDKQIVSNSARLDQIDAQGTRNIPVLVERLSGLERTDALGREALNAHVANDVSRFDAVSKRIDNIADKLLIIDRELIALGNRATAAETQARALKEISDSRIPFMQRADQALQDQAVIKTEIERIKNDDKTIMERIDRVVSALDNTYNLLNEHLRNDSAHNVPARKK